MNGMNAVKAILILLFASVYAANGPVVSGEDDKRYASNKAAGLFPFPRVGRSGGHLVWSVEPPAEHVSVKRQGLFSFPRVGRSGRPSLFPRTPPHLGMDVYKRDGEQVAGMWFGPRLGRREKRESPPFPWTFVALKDFPGVRSHEGLNPLGRESHEDNEYPNFEEENDFTTADLAYQPRSIDKFLNKSNQAI